MSADAPAGACGNAGAGGARGRDRTPPARAPCDTAGATCADACGPPAAAAQSPRSSPRNRFSPVDWPDAVSARAQRIAIAALMLAGMLLVLIGPGSYAWLNIGRAEMADAYRQKAHSMSSADEGTCYTCLLAPDTHHAAPVLQISRQHVNEVVSGGLNGLLMMIATVLGGIGADLSGRSIFAMGSASLAAYSVSAGFGTFLIESTKEEFALAQLTEEREEVRNTPEAEIAEMICHYRKRGLSEEDAQQVAGLLSKYEDFWVEHMMSEELGVQLPRGAHVAAVSGLATTASLLFFGALPLLGVVASVALSRWRGPQWYRPQFSTYISLALSAGVLTLLGFLVSRTAGSRRPCVNGLTMLVIGCGTSLVAFLLGQAGTCLSRLTDGDAKRGTASTSAAAGAERLLQSPGKLSAATAAEAAAAETSGAAAPALERALSDGGATSLAWPSFRDMFFKGLCCLWVAACTVIVGVQLLERMAYDSLRVFMYGWLTCITTGLGALPFVFIRYDAVGETALAVANAAAGGMMLAASGSMLVEAHEHCGPKDWQIMAGLAVGALFIRCSERLHPPDEGEDGESDVVALHYALLERRHVRKAMLIFIVMFCHSAAEGVAVGVAFSKRLRDEFGIYVTLLLSVHNVPEGLAVALVLVPRGVSAPLASFIAILTSVPQPLLALASFLFVDAFQGLLPLGLAFAAGAMIYVCLHELLNEAAEQLGWRTALVTTSISFAAMCAAIVVLQDVAGA